jgi:hypothetical protein
MICSKNQLVYHRIDSLRRPAKVVEIVYADKPPGERGVKLDREIGGSRWHMESDLKPAPIEDKTL